jgi:hypothetical protein
MGNGDDHARKAKEYRWHAAMAVKLAARATDPDDKAWMLKVAQGWLDLAQQQEHPPIPGAHGIRDQRTRRHYSL